MTTNLFLEKVRSDPSTALTWYVISSYYTYKLGKFIMTLEELEETEQILIQNWSTINNIYKQDATICFETEPPELQIEYHEELKIFALKFGEEIKHMVNIMREGKIDEGSEEDQVAQIVGTLKEMFASAVSPKKPDDE